MRHLLSGSRVTPNTLINGAAAPLGRNRVASPEITIHRSISPDPTWQTRRRVSKNWRDLPGFVRNGGAAI